MTTDMTTETIVDTKPFAKLALAEGRKRQSSVTGYIHYTFGDHLSRDGIPIYENLLFILSLCRSNQADHIFEGRDLLLKLYPFFKDVGAFGVYLHEWPAIRKPLLNVRMLFPLLHVYCDYSHVIGDEARETLKDMLTRLSSYVDTLDMPPLLKFQKEVFDAVFLDSPQPQFDATLCQSTKDWSEIITVAPFLEETIVWPRSDSLAIFAGAYVHEMQRMTLYDLFFGKIARDDEISPLQAALIYDFKHESVLPEQLVNWKNVQEGDKLFGFREKFTVQETRVSPGQHLFHIATSENALVCQQSKMSYEASWQEGLVCDFSFGEQAELDFYLEYTPNKCLRVNGEKATFFGLDDRLEMMGLEIVFEKVSGEGRLCGHFLRGNRRGQTCPKVKSEWAAYDWQINLKALSHQDDLVVRATIRAV